MKNHLLIIILFILFKHCAYTQTVDSLNYYLNYAKQNNPELVSSFLKYKAFDEKRNQFYSLSDPNIEIGYYLKPMELISGNQIADIKLMQMFPWFGSLKASREESGFMSESKYQEYLSKLIDICYNIKSVYYLLYKTKKEIEINKSNIKLLKTIEQIVITNYKLIDVSQTSNENKMRSQQSANNSSNSANQQSMSSMVNSSQTNNNQVANKPMNNNSMNAGKSGGLEDLFKIQIEVNDLENSISNLIDEQKYLKIKFNNLLNKNVNDSIYLPDTLIYSDNNTQFYSDSIINNPMYVMLLKDTLAYTSSITMAKKMGYPMFGIGLNYSIISKSEMSTSNMNGNDMIMPMLTFSLPIYRKKYKSKITEAELLKESSQYAANSTKIKLNDEFNSALKELNVINKSILLYSKQKDLTKKIIDITLVSLSVNSSEYEDVLRLQQQLLDYEIKENEAITNKYLTISKLMLLNGKY